MTIESLSTKLRDAGFKADPEDLAKERNIADLMGPDLRQAIGSHCLNGYHIDKQSREKWESWYAEAIKLALQVKEAKTFPWPGCSNVKFPLLTIAALNAHAQAYPAIIRGDDIVGCRVIGENPTPEQRSRAERVSKHMSYQLMETMPWDEQTDKQLLVHYIMGTTFKKTYRNNAMRLNCSELVMPQDLIINYFTKDMVTCPRASHYFTLTKNECYERYASGIYIEPTEDTNPRGQERPTGPLEVARDKAQLTQPTINDVETNYIIEQSCFLDLDGDGYAEPYAVTFNEQTGFLYRILARYYVRDIKRAKDNKIIRIEPDNYYTKFILIPSPDGGAYGLGLGRFLAPINDAVDTAINQMLDANTMNILGGGFASRGVRMKAGDTTFKPGEFKPVDVTGDDIRKSLFQLQKTGLDAAAFELLKYLIEYGERIGSSGDIQMGQIPGSGQMKAGTAQIANENGKLIFNATYKRFWRGLKEEFKKLYKLNSLYLDEGGEAFQVGEKYYKITQEDYLYPSSGIVPAADPNVVSRADKRNAALIVRQAAQSVGYAGYDQEAVEMRFLEAHDIQNIKEVYPGLKAKPPQPHPKVIEAQAKMQKEQTNAMKAKQANMVAVAKLQIQAKESQAKILNLLAQAAKLAHDAKSQDTEHAIQLLEIKLNAEEGRRDDILQTIELLMNSMKGADGDNEGATGGAAKEGGSSPMGGMAGATGNQAVSPLPATA